MTDIGLSLDEIIKKRNIRVDGRKPQNLVKRLGDRPKKPNLAKRPLVDARQKIMQSQFRRKGSNVAPMGDARFRLEALRRTNPLRRPVVPLAAALPRSLQSRIGNQPLARPRIPMDVDMLDYETPRSLVRTVDNSMPPFARRPFDWDRPVEEEDDYLALIEQRKAQRGAYLPEDLNKISITVHRKPSQLPSLHPQPSILKRPSPAAPSGLNTGLPIHSSFHLKFSTLSDRFNTGRNAEAAAKVDALKSQLKAARNEVPVAKTEPGYRIIVSNLVPSVTQEDVKELFADIGELVSSKLVRPGVAEVVYHHHEDAVKAVDVYHDRQLDGQPMKCLLTRSKLPGKLDMACLRNAIHKTVPS